MRILALATNPETGASTRFRVLQWEPYLEKAGFSLTLESFYSAQAAEVLYQRGRWATKILHSVQGTVQRRAALSRAGSMADLLLIHREYFPLGRRPFFRKLKQFPGPIVYDYDDAMFLHQREGRGVLPWLEDLDTPKEVMALSDVVFAGNQYLADYASRYARRVVVLPTCVDTERFRPLPRPREAGRRPVVGWIGSHSTAKYLLSLRPILEEVARSIRFRLYVVGSAMVPDLNGAEVVHAPWALAREVDDFLECDIGVYPLWDDSWAQGKCGFKAIEFMACGIPVVAAAVGTNRQIIEDGVNGFLAATEADWVKKLTALLLDPGLRRRLGAAGRRTVEARYSLTANAQTLIGSLRESIEQHGGRQATAV